jgi:hypothetical protein
VSRFRTQEPFYVAIERAMAEERMKRILALDVRYGCAECDLPRPIEDRDPGDEDPSP